MCNSVLCALECEARWRKQGRLATVPVAALVVQTTLLIGGCHGVGTTGVAALRAFEPVQSPDTLSDVAFLHYLATVPVATVDEGMRAMLFLVSDEESLRTFEERYEALRQREAVKRSWRLTRGQLLDKGTLAYMLRSVCGVSLSLGEVFAAWTGLGDRRAALKTCIDAGLLPYGVWNEPVKGGELLSAVAEAERYLERRAHHGP